MAQIQHWYTGPLPQVRPTLCTRTTAALALRFACSRATAAQRAMAFGRPAPWTVRRPESPQRHQRPSKVVGNARDRPDRPPCPRPQKCRSARRLLKKAPFGVSAGCVWFSRLGWGRGWEVPFWGCLPPIGTCFSRWSRVCCLGEGSEPAGALASWVYARAQPPLWWLSPSARRRRRLTAATRWWNHVLFFTTPRYGTRRFPRVSHARVRSTMGRCRR